MQIKITLCPRQNFDIPYNYNHQVQSMIYKALERDKVYSDFLHNGGYEKGFRFFTFGQIHGDYSLKNGKMRITGNIQLEIRSHSDEFCSILKNAFLKNGTVKLYDQMLDIKMIEVDYKTITSDRICFRTVSPVVARLTTADKKTLYYTPGCSGFSELLRENIILKYSALRGKSIKSDIQISEITNIKKVVTKYKGIWITAYHFHGVLNGVPELVDLVYQTGLGGRSSQGFGMIEVI